MGELRLRCRCLYRNGTRYRLNAEVLRYVILPWHVSTAPIPADETTHKNGLSYPPLNRSLVIKFDKVHNTTTHSSRMTPVMNFRWERDSTTGMVGAYGKRGFVWPVRSGEDSCMPGVQGVQGSWSCAQVAGVARRCPRECWRVISSSMDQSTLRCRRGMRMDGIKDLRIPPVSEG